MVVSLTITAPLASPERFKVTNAAPALASALTVPAANATVGAIWALAGSTSPRLSAHSNAYGAMRSVRVAQQFVEGSFRTRLGIDALDNHRTVEAMAAVLGRQ